LKTLKLLAPLALLIASAFSHSGFGTIESDAVIDEAVVDETVADPTAERDPDALRRKELRRVAPRTATPAPSRSLPRARPSFFAQHSPMLTVNVPAAMVSTGLLPPEMSLIDLVAPAAISLRLFKRLADDSSAGILFDPQLYFYWPPGFPIVGFDGGLRFWLSDSVKLELMGAIHFQSTRNSGPLVDSQLDTDWYSGYINLDYIGDSWKGGVTGRLVALRNNTVSVNEGLPTQIGFGSIPIFSGWAEKSFAGIFRILATADYILLPDMGVASNSFALKLPAQNFLRYSVGVGFGFLGGDLLLQMHRVELVKDARSMFYQFPLVTHFYSLSPTTFSGEITWEL